MTFDKKAGMKNVFIGALVVGGCIASATMLGQETLGDRYEHANRTPASHVRAVTAADVIANTPSRRVGVVVPVEVGDRVDDRCRTK